MEVVDRYLELGLRLDRHVNGLVDAYYGPAEIRERIDAEPIADPAGLVEDAGRLVRLLEDAEIEDEQRRRWLRAQVGGLDTVARRLAGEPIAYTDEVERCYGVRPGRTPEELFEEAHRALDGALPGAGDVGPRYRAWSERLEVPREALLGLAGDVNDALRARTRDRIGLPDGEEVVLELVENEPWAAFNYYLGGLRSRVVVNTDVPLYAHRLGYLVAHELYPGHHTEHAWKEELLVRGRGYGELQMILACAPESAVSEGIAEIALEVLLGGEAYAVGAEHAARAGILYDPEQARRIVDARRTLRWVDVNVALQIHEDGVSRTDAVAYLRRWLLVEEARAEKLVDFVLDPTWRAYVACYAAGEQLCAAYVGRDVERFRRLLTEQLTPADLAAAPVERS